MKKLRWVVFLLMACALLVQAASPDSSQDKTPAVSVITKEALQDHLVELQQQREQAIATVNAISGAIQECEYWLEKLKEEKQEE
ncbi:MAG: hypothetical protein J3T61_08905 [Candidatus Brocadiales bacterium]|nr:hypothetical protein [Candidatus Bathyanammoxibius sp.]